VVTTFCALSDHRDVSVSRIDGFSGWPLNCYPSFVERSGPQLLPFGSAFVNTNENDRKTVGTVTGSLNRGHNRFF
jgi:hypothetical protein